MTEETVRNRLKTVPFPGFSRDIVAFGVVKAIEVRGQDVNVRMAVVTSQAGVPEQIRQAAESALKQLEGIGRVTIEMDGQVTRPGGERAGSPSPGLGQQTGIPGVKNIIAVASGKGGVGKSTVAANLAVALQETGATVGLCDLDIYGPSIALMFGLRDPILSGEDDQLLPPERYGLKIISMGLLLDDQAPAVLRGPIVSQITRQFLRQVAWGTLDYLVLDLPPGTGDIQLTIGQTVALAGAVLVTTPQEVALCDVRKAAAMLTKLNVPLLGVVENMSYFVCPNDGNRYDIFGSGGGEREAKRLGIPLLGRVPIEIGVRESGDRGKPVVYSDPSGAAGSAFMETARTLRKMLNC